MTKLLLVSSRILNLSSCLCKFLVCIAQIQRIVVQRMFVMLKQILLFIISLGVALTNSFCYSCYISATCTVHCSFAVHLLLNYCSKKLICSALIRNIALISFTTSVTKSTSRTLNSVRICCCPFSKWQRQKKSPPSSVLL